MSSAPVISIIIAVFNGASTLPRCLESIAGQTYQNREIIVMDGGSTDGTVDILTRHSANLAYWESQSDRGIYHAWNKALGHVRGDWVCFLGADDYFWKPDVLEKLASHLPTGDDPAVRIVYGQSAVVTSAGGLLRYEGAPWEPSRRGLAWTLTLPHPGLLHHRRVFEDHGIFDETLRIVGDYDLLLRELKPYGPTREALFVPDVVTVGFQHGGVSHSPRAMAAMLSEISRVRTKHQLSALAWPSKVRLKMLLCACIYGIAGDNGFRAIADMGRRLRGKAPVWTERS